MIALTIKIFTLKALAALEGVSYTNLRQIIHLAQKNSQPLEWKDYRFAKIGSAKAWVAYPKDSDIEFICGDESANPSPLAKEQP
jgi:hypothetical protein